jgi:hypothetical protein
MTDEPVEGDVARQKRAGRQHIERDQDDRRRFVGMVPGVMIAAILAVEGQEHQAGRIEGRHEGGKDA